MKKLVAIVFLVVYSNVGFGIAINYHFCGGSLTKISILNFGDRASCSCNDTDMPMDCCKDQVHTAKADNHKIAQQAIVQKVISFTLDLPQVINFTKSLSGYNSFENSSSFLLDKRRFSHPIFLLNRVFRI